MICEKHRIEMEGQPLCPWCPAPASRPESEGLDLEADQLMALAEWLCHYCQRNQDVDAWCDLGEAGRQVWARDAEALLAEIRRLRAGAEGGGRP